MIYVIAGNRNEFTNYLIIKNLSNRTDAAFVSHPDDLEDVFAPSEAFHFVGSWLKSIHAFAILSGVRARVAVWEGDPRRAKSSVQASEDPYSDVKEQLRKENAHVNEAASRENAKGIAQAYAQAKDEEARDKAFDTGDCPASQADRQMNGRHEHTIKWLNTEYRSVLQENRPQKEERVDIFFCERCPAVFIHSYIFSNPPSYRA